MPRNCSTADDLNNFIEVSRQSQASELDNEIEQFGCVLSNCISHKWDRQLFTKSEYIAQLAPDNVTAISMIQYFFVFEQVSKFQMLRIRSDKIFKLYFLDQNTPGHQAL